MNKSSSGYDPATYEEHVSHLKSFDTNDGKMAYIDEGEGHPVLLVHGIPTSSWLYRHIVTELLGKGFRVIVPDMLGFGASDKPNGVEIYSHENHGKRMASLIRHLVLKDWIHVVHDGGGVWSWEMLLNDGARPGKIVILNTIVFDEGFKPPMKFKRNFIGKKYSKTYCSPLLGKPMVRATFKNGMHEDKLTEDAFRGYHQPLQGGSHNALYYFFTSFEEISQKLSTYHVAIIKSKAAITVIWGKEDDILVGEKQIPLIQSKFNVADDEIHILEESGHFVQEEEPVRIAEIISNL